jgi:hypothetical protein
MELKKRLKGQISFHIISELFSNNWNTGGDAYINICIIKKLVKTLD